MIYSYCTLPEWLGHGLIDDMSISKRILFDKNPVDDLIRERLRSQSRDYAAQFTFRIPTRRKNPAPGSYWDRIWPLSLSKAEKELGIEALHVNDSIMVRTAADQAALLARAKEIYGRLSERSNAPAFGKGDQ